MATKDDRPGLLSKMAMFVRNPTKDWSELDRLEPEQESGYDKQALKAMIERKRQNDFVRRREFDQLRKLRSRDAAAVSGVARPSVFQSSLTTDQDGRAVTLKKIDEIEAQMSRQWWKGKQEAAATTQNADLVADGQPPIDFLLQTVPPEPTTLSSAGSESYSATVPSALGFSGSQSGSAEFVATQMGAGMPPPVSTHVPLARGSVPGAALPPPVSVPGAGFAAATPDFSTSGLFAMEPSDAMATDPDLEEAAIRFANGDDAGAESGLLEALRGDVALPDSAFSWAAALLDLYRATHNRAGFDRAVKEFAPYFDNAVPVWAPIGDARGPAAGVASAAPVPDEAAVAAYPDSDAIWECPSELTAQAMEHLREAMASNPMPWHLGWSRLVRIAPGAMPLLAGLFSSLCNEPVVLRFSGMDRLVQALRTMMPSGDRSVPPAWWAVRLNVLRTMQLQDEFELVALDYCVTYEVSPPAWEKARCQFTDVAVANTAPMRVETGDWGTGFNLEPTAPMGLDAGTDSTLSLQGLVQGDATQALAGLDEGRRRPGDRIIVACDELVRVDFSAAGSILNWVAMRQSEGCHVQFRNVHRLVAAFFNVIGINEHARVVPRPL